MTELSVKARRFDPRNDETIDLKHFDLVEVKHGHARITIRLSRDGDGPERLIVSGDEQLTLFPRAANWVEFAL